MNDPPMKANTTQKKRAPIRKINQHCKRDTQLWFMMLITVMICFVTTWISFSYLIFDEMQMENNRPIRTPSSEWRSSQLAPVVPVITNTSSVFSSLDTKIVDDHTQHTPSQSYKNNRNKNGKKAFVRYRLEYDKPYSVEYGPDTQCTVGIKGNKWGRKLVRRVRISEPLSKILHVTTYLQTNLKIITVGDSVGIQFHQVLEEALQPPTSTTGVGAGNETYRTIYQIAWGRSELSSVSAPVNGGGALAALRMNGLLLEEGRGKPLPNAIPNQTDFSGGWSTEHIRQILDHNYTTTVNGTGSGETATTTTQSIESFDVMIFRVPHGWVPASAITRERLVKALSFARELLGVRTIIIQTLFLNNNVKTMEDLNDMHQTNRMIHELVDSSWGNPDLPDLLLMDFGGWTDQLTELNAQLAGMDTKSNANYTLERLHCNRHPVRFPPSIAMVCVEKNVKPNSCRCDQNMVSIDGMHWCMETVGGRIIAAISCLLECSLLISDFDLAADKSPDTKRRALGKCQQRCNDQFMSLREASSLDTNMTTALI